VIATRDYEARAADGVRLALHRLAPRGGSRLPPLLLVPGTFTTRDFWVGARGQGMAGVLAGAGFDTWVLETRGHGASDRPAGWTMNDWIALDAPAAAAVVLGESRADRFFWVGHSAGGVVGAAFGGSALAGAAGMAGLVLLGAPGPGTLRGGRRVLARAGHLGAALLPWMRVSGKPLRLGPEPEPARLVRDWLRWNLEGAWRDPAGLDYLAGLPAARLPVLAVAGSGDRLLAPPAAVRDLLDRFGSRDRTLVVAGRETGFARDYDHAGLVIGSGARAEIWPRVVGWLRERAAPGATDGGTEP
jgi:predicted alpha/beta hydrolase